MTPTYHPATRYGGPIYSVHGLCSALAARGHHVEVFSTNVDGPGVSDVPLGRPVSMDGVDVTYFPTGIGRRLYCSPMMTKFLSRRISEFDLVHLHSVFLWPTLAGATVARRHNVPYVLSPRGMLVPKLIARKSKLKKKAWIWFIERRNVSNAGSLHVTSDLEKNELEILGMAPKRIDVIPNGFDLPPDALAAMDKKSPHAREVTVLSVGRISWKKGLDRLIASMAHVQSAELIIAGNDDDNYKDHLQRLAGAIDLTERIHFVGAVQGRRKWDLFTRADVFALASHSENFAIAALEAMACGLPVVVTPEVGLAKVIDDAGAGIVADGNPEAFGAAIQHLVSSPELRRAMGQRGRMLARTYNWNAIAESMEQLYEKLVTRTSENQVTNV